jgi:hypothetical protein
MVVAIKFKEGRTLIAEMDYISIYKDTVSYPEYKKGDTAGGSVTHLLDIIESICTNCGGHWTLEWESDDTTRS